jgi:hypothetical protein
MELKELAKKVYPNTEVDINGKIFYYTPDLQRDGFIKGYEEALKQLKECWNDSNTEMRKCFSSSYVPKTFEQWLNEKQNIQL